MLTTIVGNIKYVTDVLAYDIRRDLLSGKYVFYVFQDFMKSDFRFKRISSQEVLGLRVVFREGHGIYYRTYYILTDSFKFYKVSPSVQSELIYACDTLPNDWNVFIDILKHPGNKQYFHGFLLVVLFHYFAMLANVRVSSSRFRNCLRYTILLFIGVVIGHLNCSKVLEGFQVPVYVLIDSYKHLFESDQVIQYDVVCEGPTSLDRLFVKFLKELLGICKVLDKDLYDRVFFVDRLLCFCEEM